MKKLGLVFVMFAALLFSSNAEAHHRHHHRHHRHHYSHHLVHKYATYDRSRAHDTQINSYDRPRDCYGIPWCGCWLRHEFGFANTVLNLAAAWSHVGQPASIDTANVVVWPHHVGKLLKHDGNHILVKSGNDGHAVRTRWRTTAGVIAFRRVGGG